MKLGKEGAAGALCRPPRSLSVGKAVLFRGRAQRPLHSAVPVHCSNSALAPCRGGLLCGLAAARTGRGGTALAPSSAAASSDADEGLPRLFLLGLLLLLFGRRVLHD